MSGGGFHSPALPASGPRSKPPPCAAARHVCAAEVTPLCAAQHDPDFDAEPDTMGPCTRRRTYAIPLYPGGPKTKGGLRANARRAVLDWDDTPIPRLYAAGEMCSVFQCVYQGGDNLAECIVFGRIAGQNAAAEVPLETASNPH